MQAVSFNDPIPEDLRGGYVALGNFDGVHPGHSAVIDGARVLGEGRAPLLVVTFDPTPRDLFAPNGPPMRIHTPLQRDRTLESLGVDGRILIPFDLRLSQLSDVEFVDGVLVDRMGVRGVAVGSDFRFGRGRMGDADRLAALGAERGLDVRIVDEVSDEVGKLSSTRIREAIATGDMASAAKLLGDWWVIDSIVEHGEKRGRSLGFPTANMRLGNLIQPPFGVYAVWCREVGEADWRQCVASFGRTPTTGLRDPLLEVHVLDFDEDLYGKRLEVGFAGFLRPEAQFDSVEELVAQMHRDRADAVSLLGRLSPPR